MASIPALERQRHVDLYEIEDSLISRANSKTDRAGMQRNSVSKKSKEKMNEKRSTTVYYYHFQVL